MILKKSHQSKFPQNWRKVRRSTVAKALGSFALSKHVLNLDFICVKISFEFLIANAHRLKPNLTYVTLEKYRRENA